MPVYCPLCYAGTSPAGEVPAVQVLVVRPALSTDSMTLPGPIRLSPLGRRQAAATGRRLAALASDAPLVSSPAPVARETAALIGELTGAIPVLDPGLEEVAYHRTDPDAALQPAWQRSVETFQRLARQPPAPAGHLLVVTHGPLLAAFLAWLTLPDGYMQWRTALLQGGPWELLVPPASVTTLHYSQDGWHLLSLGDTSHLAGLPTEMM